MLSYKLATRRRSSCNYDHVAQLFSYSYFDLLVPLPLLPEATTVLWFTEEQAVKNDERSALRDKHAQRLWWEHDQDP